MIGVAKLCIDVIDQEMNEMNTGANSPLTVIVSPLSSPASFPVSEKVREHNAAMQFSCVSTNCSTTIMDTYLMIPNAASIALASHYCCFTWILRGEAVCPAAVLKMESRVCGISVMWSRLPVAHNSDMKKQNVRRHQRPHNSPTILVVPIIAAINSKKSNFTALVLTPLYP